MKLIIALFALLVFVCTLNIGDGLKCYLCDNCGTDESQYEVKECENPNPRCYLCYTRFHLNGTELYSRHCSLPWGNASERRQTEEAANSSRRVRRLALKSTFCTHCNSDLCNDANYSLAEKPTD